MPEMPERRLRTKVLDPKDRRAIIDLYRSGDWTMKSLAERFGVSQPRISQIVNNTYGEHAALYPSDV